MKEFRGASCLYLGEWHHWLSGKESTFQWIQSLGLEDPIQKEMATHSSILAWETPWTENESDTRLKTAKHHSQEGKTRDTGLDWETILGCLRNEILL